MAFMDIQNISNQSPFIYKPTQEIHGKQVPKRNVERKVTVAKSIKSLQIKIINLWTPELLQIERKYHALIMTSFAFRLPDPSAVVTAVKDIVETFLAVRPQETFTGQYYN